jgi:hypothetical protein
MIQMEFIGGPWDGEQEISRRIDPPYAQRPGGTTVS